MDKIRVLVVDDSLVFREALSSGILFDKSIEVVATAIDPFDARDKIIEFRPDVITCDVEMPKMNGIEFIKRLMPQYPIPIIVVSTVEDAVFDAMNAGAVDFVKKPKAYTKETSKLFFNEVIGKIRIAAKSKVITHRKEGILKSFDSKTRGTVDVIAIGASTGGPEAIAYLLSQLPSNIPGIVIVQHMPPGYTKLFAQRLDSNSDFEVKEAESGDIVKPGRVIIAQGDKHLRIIKKGENYIADCFEGERVNWHCPSVDVMFESVANEAKNRSLGIILTGMGSDGSNGLLAMKESGAITIGQNEASSVVYGMPKVSFDIGAVQRQAPLSDIPSLVVEIINIKK